MVVVSISRINSHVRSYFLFSLSFSISDYMFSGLHIT